jgi:hypothetical protein
VVAANGDACGVGAGAGSRVAPRAASGAHAASPAPPPQTMVGLLPSHPRTPLPDAHPHAHADALRSTTQPCPIPLSQPQAQRTRFALLSCRARDTAVGRLRRHASVSWSDNLRQRATALYPPQLARRSHWRVQCGLAFCGGEREKEKKEEEEEEEEGEEEEEEEEREREIKKSHGQWLR